ncbi:uncharacterized protein LOC112127303 [Cimex lectularius]|uniref:Uncharacterized protein n=1 Tax=Cimex lectularius TaxID=79782 RepID=A0A8I6TMG4_CIMLE|nr:uncharacterized protein LOC112127303 [Cimex lectularius]
MSSPRKIGMKSPARPPLLRTDCETDSDSNSAPPAKRQQQIWPDSPPPPLTSTDSSSMPELLPDEVKTESSKNNAKIINLRLSFDDLPPQEGKDIFKKYTPQEMTCCNLDWLANTEVRLTLSKLSLSSKEERYRPSAPTPTAAECPVIIKPIPKRLTVPGKPEIKEESREREDGSHRISEGVQEPCIRTEDGRWPVASRPPGMFAFWKRNISAQRISSAEYPIERSPKNDDAEVPYPHSD